MNISKLWLACIIIPSFLIAKTPLPPPPNISHSAGGKDCNDGDVLALVRNIKHLPILSAFISDNSNAIMEAKLFIEAYQKSMSATQSLIKNEIDAIKDIAETAIPPLRAQIDEQSNQLNQQTKFSADALCNAQAVTYMIGPLSTVLATSTDGKTGCMSTSQYTNYICALSKLNNCIDPKKPVTKNCQTLLGDSSKLSGGLLQSIGQYLTSKKDKCGLSISSATNVLKMAQANLTNTKAAITAIQQSVSSIKSNIMLKFDQMKRYDEEVTQRKARITQLQKSMTDAQTQIAILQATIEDKRATIEDAKNKVLEIQSQINVPDDVYKRCPQYLQAILS